MNRLYLYQNVLHFIGVRGVVAALFEVGDEAFLTRNEAPALVGVPFGLGKVPLNHHWVHCLGTHMARVGSVTAYKAKFHVPRKRWPEPKPT